MPRALTHLSTALGLGLELLLRPLLRLLRGRRGRQRRGALLLQRGLPAMWSDLQAPPRCPCPYITPHPQHYNRACPLPTPSHTLEACSCSRSSASSASAACAAVSALRACTSAGSSPQMLCELKLLAPLLQE